MKQQSHMDDPIIIVGAGLAGLAAGRLLHDAGLAVVLLDKGRGVGGRMATRRIQGVPFDHGAQFFTVQDPRFGQWVDKWRSEGLVREWSHGFPDEQGRLAPDRHPRYRAHPGMTAIPKALARGLDVRLEARVERVEQEGQRWRVFLQPGESIQGRALLLTPPVPQSLALLQQGDVELEADVKRTLQELHYDPCISLMALFKGPNQIPQEGAIYFSQGPLAWISDNRQKGISGDHFAATVHAGPDFSREYWQAADEAAAQALLAAAAPWLNDQVAAWQLHRWRYSRPTNPYPKRLLSVPGKLPLIFAGDAFGGPRVEGAFLSGCAAADALMERG